MTARRALRRLGVGEIPSVRRQAIDEETLEIARRIVDDVRARGELALREQAERLGDIEPGASPFIQPSSLEAALEALPAAQGELLQRTADRIRRFAEAQRASLSELRVELPGGHAGHWVSPVERAGCYAPGGRFPLPSSVLMTAVTARAAGVGEVWVASPRPTAVTLAAAAVAGVDGLLAAGGAQAIAALTFGAGPLGPADVVVGPGNRFVTAAKQLVSGQVAIDMLAGPSELVVFADASGDAQTIAADLLAQAEHDPEALPALVTTSAALADAVDEALQAQLALLATAVTASRALEGGFAVVVDSIEEGARVCDRLAPEHLELHLERPDEVAPLCRHWGGLFIGPGAAEVLGDYGAGPNHTLPTGGTARSTGGLSVLHFLRVRTWLRIDDLEGAASLVADAEALAQLEGLAGHAASAHQRRRRR
jgi:histidinol dehydrogenase